MDLALGFLAAVRAGGVFGGGITHVFIAMGCAEGATNDYDADLGLCSGDDLCDGVCIFRPYQCVGIEFDCAGGGVFGGVHAAGYAAPGGACLIA